MSNTLDIHVYAKLQTGVHEHAENLPGSWFITHGLGTPAAGTYTEVAFPSQLPYRADPVVAEEAVRQIADQLYGNRWAFIYPPEGRQDAIDRWKLKRRERVVVTEIRVWS